MIKIKESITHLNIRLTWTLVTLCLIIAALSFYFVEGYYNLGEEKYRIYLKTAGIAVPVWLIMLLIHVIRTSGLQGLFERISGFGALEWFLVLLNVSGLIATLTSDFARTSVWGYDGWHMGFVVQLLMSGGCLMCADLFKNGSKRAIYFLFGVIFTVTTIVFVLGVINRFSIYPFYMFGQAEDFISTLGNINWFCGYWSIWMSIGCGIFMITERTWLKYLSGAYVWLCSVTGICCGASSCYLVWLAISFAALLWALDDSNHMADLCNMEVIIFAGLPAVRFIGALRPYRMWYDSALLKSISYEDKWIMPYIIGTVFFAVMAEVYKRRQKDRSYLRYILVGGGIGLITAVVIIIILNSSIPGGIWPVRGKGIFTWSIDWGNGRGGIWMVSIELIKRMFPFKIFFGVGCDCLCDYAYSMPDILTQLHRYMGELYLTNSHNEVLSMLINEGIMGTVAYFGFQITHLVSASKSLDKNTGLSGDAQAVLFGTILAVVSYMVIGIVGFMQILSTPFMFMAVGMASGLIKRKNINIITDSDQLSTGEKDNG
ncbi:MAG: hypothetical protein K6G12_01745 [Lachnospiraceae bacterium]|nr:hypothetical protein [Lachnospiraceae bacterium]